jgi:hypothetical protein
MEPPIHELWARLQPKGRSVARLHRLIARVHKAISEHKEGS